MFAILFCALLAFQTPEVGANKKKKLAGRILAWILMAMGMGAIERGIETAVKSGQGDHKVEVVIPPHTTRIQQDTDGRIWIVLGSTAGGIVLFIFGFSINFLKKIKGQGEGKKEDIEMQNV